MNAEILILVGLLMILSGTIWLVSEAQSPKIEKEKSITSAFRNYYNRYRYNKYYFVLGLTAFLGGIYFWWMSDRNIAWTILWITTCLWYLRVKRSVSLTGLLWLGGAVISYFSIQLGLIWLLTVIGSGYFDYSTSREKQNILSQISVVLNPVSSFGKFIISRISKPNLEEFEKTNVVGIENESIVNCPVCTTEMKLAKIIDGDEKILFDRCPKCQSIFFDDLDWIWVIENSRNNKTEGKLGDYMCPRCQIKMKRLQSELYSQKNLLYTCKECMGNLLV